jgi:hypothetical protein
MRHFLRCFILLLLFVAAAAHAATPLENYLDGGAFLVASLDLDDATSDESRQWLIATIEAAAPALGSGDATMPAMITRQAISQLRELRDLGAAEIVLVVAIEDLTMNHGPLLVTKLPDEAAAAKGRDWLQPRLKMTPGVEARLSGSMLLVATTATLDRYEKLTPVPRTDLVDPVTEDGATFAAVLSPGADARRVLRELWPMLPSPYDKLTGPLVADDVRGVTAIVQLGAAPNAALSIHSPNPSAREAAAKAIAAGLQSGVAWIEANQPSYTAAAKNAADLLAPKRGDAAVTIRLDATDSAVKQLAVNILAPAVVEAQERAKRTSKVNDMKQIGIAANRFYDDGHGFFPANIVDKDAKPLLSWRVLTLPYIEQQALFEKLHLDEPWDSPHNLEVAKHAAPDLYCRGNRDGMTTYLRPVYPGSDLSAARGDVELVEKLFAGQRCYLQPGDKFQDLTDGPSQSIMVAEVAPEHAVFWTKPEDWQVDLKEPLAKLRTEGRHTFAAGFHDGSARSIAINIDAEMLKRLITKAGGEPIPQ